MTQIIFLFMYLIWWESKSMKIPPSYYGVTRPHRKNSWILPAKRTSGNSLQFITVESTPALSKLQLYWNFLELHLPQQQSWAVWLQNIQDEISESMKLRSYKTFS